MARLVVQGNEILASRLQPTNCGAGLLADDLVAGQKVRFRLTVTVFPQQRPTKLQLGNTYVQMARRKRQLREARA